MKQKAMPLVIGNWKANPLTLDQAKKLFVDIRKGVRNRTHAEVAIAPPFPFISEVGKLSASDRITIAAQEVFQEIGGAYTGEVSLSMLQSVGVQSVIVGHSERRAMGTTDATVAKKAALITKHKLMAVVCVGEQKRDSHGDYLDFVKAEVKAVLKALTPSQMSHLVIAYEPIWAIGTGKTATAQDAEEMKLYIQKVIQQTAGKAAVKKIRVLYGGSVKAENAEVLLREGNVDGFLVGGASLKADAFAKIVDITHTYHKNQS